MVSEFAPSPISLFPHLQSPRVAIFAALRVLHRHQLFRGSHRCRLLVGTRLFLAGRRSTGFIGGRRSQRHLERVAQSQIGSTNQNQRRGFRSSRSQHQGRELFAVN